jgi:hypothetical protein
MPDDYAFRGTDPHSPENGGCWMPLQQQIPFIYFRHVSM